MKWDGNGKRRPDRATGNTRNLIFTAQDILSYTNIDPDYDGYGTKDVPPSYFGLRSNFTFCGMCLDDSFYILFWFKNFLIEA